MAIGTMTDEARAAAHAAAAAANLKAGFSNEQQTAGTKLNADFNFFLKMLTTQLQHQDPSEPMDVSQMTQQITQMSGVEQQIQTNTKLDRLVASNAAVTYQSQLATAASYIGREVETAGSSGQVYAGQGAFSYILPERATSVEITLKNSAGQTVYTGPGAIDKGRNVLLWDGKSSGDKVQQPDGVYSMSISAKNAKGEVMKVETRSVGLVSGFERDKDGNVLLSTGIGNGTVLFGDVLTVRPATRAVFDDPDDKVPENGNGGTDTVVGGNDTVGGGGDTVGGGEDAEETA